MKPLVVSDLDAMARKAVQAGVLSSLSLDLHLLANCHPEAGLRTTRAYEGENVMLTCATCNLFVCNLKIAKE